MEFFMKRNAGNFFAVILILFLCAGCSVDESDDSLFKSLSVYIPSSNATETDTSFKNLKMYHKCSSADLNSYIEALEENTVSTPYYIELLDLDNNVKPALNLNRNKYVDIKISDTVTLIGSCAFLGCTSITSVTIPNSVSSIIVDAFFGCTSLTSIKVDEGNQIYDSRNNCNAIIETGSNTLVKGCPTTVIPNSVTSIGSGAFLYCSGLTSITIPDSVTSIGDKAFIGCTSLRTINYTGTQVQWNAVIKGYNWNFDFPSDCVINYNYKG